jgi:phosphate transport system permease protein
LKGKKYPAELADVPLNKLDTGQAAHLLMLNLGTSRVKDLIFTEVIKPQVVKSWPLWDSLTRRSEIKALAAGQFPKAELKWRSWVSWKFISSPLDPRTPDATGLRPALIGSLMIILITIGVAFPVGVGAAIYLEEYAGKNFLNRLIQTNINNLAGVPSIIYGMLGLAIFVRVMVRLTSGNLFGSATANGRTILSAGFTLALLILPLIIINAQEAIRAVPGSLRQASYGLGATRWQTIWHHVLPYAMPGILTGTILAISRAIGETAPLVLVGAATFITQDPDGPFSNFTALPMLIYRWTGLPQAEFRNAAAAAIVVLLAMLLTLNSVAVILRNRFSRSLS